MPDLKTLGARAGTTTDAGCLGQKPAAKGAPFYGLDDTQREAIGAALKAAAARHGLKPGQVMMPLRVLVCGTKETPAIDAVLALLGRESTAARMAAAVS